MPGETAEAAKGVLLSWPILLGSVVTVASSVSGVILFFKQSLSKLQDDFYGKDRQRVQELNESANRLSLVELTNEHQTGRLDELSDKVGGMQKDISEIKIKISQNHGETMGALRMLTSNLPKGNKETEN